MIQILHPKLWELWYIPTAGFIPSFRDYFPVVLGAQGHPIDSLVTALPCLRQGGCGKVPVASICSPGVGHVPFSIAE